MMTLNNAPVEFRTLGRINDVYDRLKEWQVPGRAVTTT